MADELLGEIEHDLVSGAPLADTLRKCVLLGGRAGSVDLREWATRELKGYDSIDDIPDFRRIPAGLRVDAVTGNAIITGQNIDAAGLPEFARERIKNEVPLTQGVAELQALAETAERSDGVKLSPPGASVIGQAIDKASGNPFQHIQALYWSVGSAPLYGVLDHIRTSVAEMVAEMRAGLPKGEETPSAELADQAVNIAIHGSKSRVTVVASHAADGSSAVSTMNDEPPTTFWTRSRRVGAAIAGTASVVGLLLAVGVWQHWP